MSPKLLYIYLLLLFLIHGCQSQEKNTGMKHQSTNDLSKETSPYLLQHAHNPVNWKPWNSEVLDLAKKEQKLIVISIGYSACHWCHVMEEESFENKEVAEIMNKNFIAIKVDREERPDVDQVYMNAVQLMTGRGGWPLNVVTLPDGRPIWGGTYFKKNDWISILKQLQKQFKNQPEAFYDYADKLEEGITAFDLINHNNAEDEFDILNVDHIVNQWSKSFDHQFGGTKRSPKFMLPNNYLFLLKYAYLKQDSEILDFVNLTLTKMTYGGVHDQIGGGFARYSTDIRWHVPHFEKMLYDNAQLVSLYAQAYKLTKNELYKSTIQTTLKFVERELYHKNGYFYSSLDADSYNSNHEKEEGAYYIWTKEELKSELQDDYKLFSDYFSINEYGYWEDGKYVLARKKETSKIAEKHRINSDQLQTIIDQCIQKLHKARALRKPPALDNKTLTSWNALMLIGYLDAYEALGNNDYLNTALKNARFINENQLKPDGSLYHNFKNGNSSINAYLEDYATTIEAFIKLHENTLDTEWLYLAKRLTDYCFNHFYNNSNSLFYFTSAKDDKLIVRNIEFRDNVIPASNSIMAKNLFQLGHHFGNQKYINTSKKMLRNVFPEIKNYGSGFSNWLDLYLNYSTDFKEIVITGEKALKNLKTLKTHYLPSSLFTGYDSSVKDNLLPTNLPLLTNRIIEGKTYFYICENSVCQLPTEDINTALTLINKN